MHYKTAEICQIQLPKDSSPEQIKLTKKIPSIKLQQQNAIIIQFLNRVQSEEEPIEKRLVGFKKGLLGHTQS